MNGQGIAVGAAAIGALAVLSLSPLAYDRLHTKERAAEATKVLNAANDKMMDGMMGDKLVFGGDPDLDFVNMMIPHHVGAIDMALAEEDLGRDKAVKNLATRIEKAQQPQIDQMQKWRVGRTPVPTAQGPAVKDALNAANDRMMTDMVLNEAARKLSPDAQFLVMMIPHHQGAVDMGKAELQYGQNAEIKALAQAIITAQEKEIAEMKAWLKAHGG